MKKNKKIKHILSTINQQGFTLVEVMIALSVLAFIMLAVITVTESSQTISERVVREDRESLSVETALSRLEWDFSHIYSPLYFSQAMNPNALGEDRAETYNQILNYYQTNQRFSNVSFDSLPIPSYTHPEKSTLAFFTSSNRRKFQNIKQSHFAWVQYSLESDKSKGNTSDDEIKGEALVRKFIPNNVYSKESLNWEETKSQVLMRKVKKMVFEFWNPATNKWTENLDIVKDGKNMIKGLKLTLTYFDPDNQERTIVRIYRPLFPHFEPEDMYKFLNGENLEAPGDESVE